MIKYKTIKDCAVDIICKEGDRLSNKQIAEKVCDIMKSDTTDKCIAWYKNKINRGLIKVDNDKCAWLKKGNIKKKDLITENLDETILENEAERYVREYEKSRTQKYPIYFKKGSNTPGYDFDSGDRHIEVKAKKKKRATWLTLTAKETSALIHDEKYFLYLVEGDFEKNTDNIDLYVIPKDDLLSMAQLKIQARLTQLSNLEKRKHWKKDFKT